MKEETTQSTSLAYRFPSETRRLRYILLAASLSLGVGLVAPIITLEKFVFVQNTFSVLSGVQELLQEGQIFLFLVITGFSVVLPILKLGVLFKLTHARTKENRRIKRYLRLMHDYGRWSMLDVFVVAILVVAVKLGAIANVQMRFGLYAFAAAVFLTMYVTAKTAGLTNALQPPPGSGD